MVSVFIRPICSIRDPSFHQHPEPHVCRLGGLRSQHEHARVIAQSALQKRISH